MSDLTPEESVEMQRLIVRRVALRRQLAVIDRMVAEEKAQAQNACALVCAAADDRFSVTKAAIATELDAIARKIETGEDDIITR